LDLAEAHILALEGMSDAHRVFHLGNGTGFSVRQVIEAARAVTGAPIPAVVGARRPGDPPRLVASSALIRNELGWTPRYTDLEQIIATAWRWHQSNPAGYPD